MAKYYPRAAKRRKFQIVETSVANDKKGLMGIRLDIMQYMKRKEIPHPRELWKKDERMEDIA